MSREVWVLEDHEGYPVRSALRAERARPSAAQATQGYRVVRYVPAFEVPVSRMAHTGPCSTGCTCLLANPLGKAAR